MPQDELVHGTPEDWLVRAAGHLRFAQQPKPDEGFWEDLAFHAQQAAELAVKAVYLRRDIRFRITHDLEELLDSLRGHGLSIPAGVLDADVLTIYATKCRYPGTTSAVTEQAYKEAVAIAATVLEWAKSQVAESSL